MKLIDLSVVVNEQTPAYPGDPHIKIETLAEFDGAGYNDHSVSFGIHSSGTHIDAPNHMVKSGKTIDEIPIDQFIGRGRLVEGLDFTKVKQAGIEAGDIVLFHTGMSKIYHKPEYYSDRPAMTEEIAYYLAEKKIKMVGLDMCSPDKEPFPVHRILLSAGILIIENMTNLDKLVGKEFMVYALPIRLALDGAPTRVIAQLKA